MPDNNTFYERFGAVILLVVALMLPPTVWAAVRALQSNKNDVKEWLPDTFEATQDYKAFQRHFGDETFVLASWEGCTLDDPRVGRLAKALSAPASPDAPHYFHRAVTGESVLARLMEPPTSLSFREAVARLQGTLIGPDGEQTCVALTLSDAGRENLRATLTEVYRAAGEVGIPREELRLGGPPVDNVTIDLEGERMLVPLMGLCGIVGLVLAWWYLRDVRLTLMVLVGGVYSAGICLALVWALGGQMSSVLLTMPAVVYTAGLATAMHLINYYRHVCLRGGLRGAVPRTVRSAWLPCVLSSGTTSLGLVSLCISELVPIRTFGFYTALGVMATVGFMFLYLPSALQLWPPTVLGKLEDEEDSLLDPKHRRQMRTMGAFVVNRQRAVWILFLTLMLVCGFGLTRARTTINLMSLFSPDAQIIHDYRWLESRLGPLVPMEIVVRFDEQSKQLTQRERMQIVEQIQQAAEEIPEVGGSMSAVTFAPDLAPRRGGLRGLLSETGYAELLNKRLSAHREDFVEEGYLALDKSGGEELWRISLRVAALADIDYGTFIDDIRAHVEPVVARQHAASDEFVGVTYTGMTPVVYMAERALLDGLIRSFFGAFVMIALVMSVLFRDVRAGLLAMLPNVFPMAVVFGLMSWFEIALDIGTMMTASVAMGVCVDDTVHFASWFRSAVRQGMSRREAVIMSYEHSAGVIYQSTAIVSLGLLTFALSTFMPTRRFGLLMFTLLSCGLVADLALTPVILSGSLGRFFTRGCQPGDRREPAEDDIGEL